MKKEKICKYCNKPLEQGHRIDNCKNKKWPKIYTPSNNKMYIPSKYNENSFERVELPNSMILSTSGAALIKGETKVVSGEQNLQAWEEILKFSKKKVESLKKKA